MRRDALKRALSRGKSNLCGCRYALDVIYRHGVEAQHPATSRLVRREERLERLVEEKTAEVPRLKASMDQIAEDADLELYEERLRRLRNELDRPPPSGLGMVFSSAEWNRELMERRGPGIRVVVEPSVPAWALEIEEQARAICEALVEALDAASADASASAGPSAATEIPEQ